ncbi:MAG: magnesium transporter, partial [Myxococcales bacterium]|nr:magnesium transporter [Myxococcales bacterium]
VDDVIDVMREEATEDMLKLAGTDDEEILSRSAFGAARIRFPWLFVSWLGGVMAINIVTGFQSTLSRVVALAAFMPVINGMGGNIGSQSATITVRGLATGRLLGRGILPVVLKELRTGVLLGVGYGVLLFGVAQFLEGNTRLSIVVGSSICASMVFASVLGSLLPMLFHRVDVDPAVASGPFVTTCLDIIGISVYFLLATALLL